MLIKGLKDNYKLVLCKINGEPVGTIFYENLSSLSKGIEKVRAKVALEVSEKPLYKVVLTIVFLLNFHPLLTKLLYYIVIVSK